MSRRQEDVVNENCDAISVCSCQCKGRCYHPRPLDLTNRYVVRILYEYVVRHPIWICCHPLTWICWLCNNFFRMYDVHMYTFIFWRFILLMQYLFINGRTYVKFLYMNESTEGASIRLFMHKENFWKRNNNINNKYYRFVVAPAVVVIVVVFELFFFILE